MIIIIKIKIKMIKCRRCVWSCLIGIKGWNPSFAEKSMESHRSFE